MTRNLPAELPPDPAQQQADEATVDAGFWTKIRRHARRIPFAEEAVAAWYCTRDSRTPSHVKASLLAALAYLVVPADMLPDFLPILGFSDDATLFWAVWHMLSRHITDEHRAKAAEALDVEGLRE